MSGTPNVAVARRRSVFDPVRRRRRVGHDLCSGTAKLGVKTAPAMVKAIVKGKH